MAGWSFLTNHAYVLLRVGQHPNSTLREIAAYAGITDRAASSILRLLEADNLISRTKRGRKMHYTVDIDAVLSHRTQGGLTVRELVTLLDGLMPPGR